MMMYILPFLLRDQASPGMSGQVREGVPRIAAGGIRVRARPKHPGISVSHIHMTLR